jgi:phosphoribosyl-AMP cyclohydrolase / phosphoribosyl-ATP pyrophosphohydrolase
VSEITIDAEKIDWDKAGGLVPAIVQDAETQRVLMLGYMNRAALAATLASGLVTFYSRSKKRLWQKGESSGHTLHLVSIAPDCDSDALLVRVRPHGPACHRGTVSCFDPAP